MARETIGACSPLRAPPHSASAHQVKAAPQFASLTTAERRTIRSGDFGRKSREEVRLGSVPETPKPA